MLKFAELAAAGMVTVAGKVSCPPGAPEMPTVSAWLRLPLREIVAPNALPDSETEVPLVTSVSVGKIMIG